MENLAKDLNLLILPSTLWGIHIDPKTEFIGILHVNLVCNRIAIDKAIVLTEKDSHIKASVFVNDEIVHIPDSTDVLTGISSLSSLVYTLNDIKFCMNSNDNYVYPQCSKYVLNSDRDFCDFCTLDVFNNELNCDPPSIDDGDEVDDAKAIKEKYNCDVNLEDYSTKQLLDYHEVTKHKERNKLCTVCGKTFNCRSSMKHHMLTHANQKPFICNVCNKQFAKKYNLNVHLRVHSGERPYVCSKCGKTFATRSNFTTHMKASHTDDKKHPCDFCDMTFVHPRVLRIHMRKHTGEKPYNCQICGKVFSRKIHLTIHTRTHTGERPHICSTCQKGFSTSGNLNAHLKSSKSCGLSALK